MAWYLSGEKKFWTSYSCNNPWTKTSSKPAASSNLPQLEGLRLRPGRRFFLINRYRGQGFHRRQKVVEKGVGLIAEDFVFTGQDQALIIGGIGEKPPDQHF